MDILKKLLLANGIILFLATIGFSSAFIFDDKTENLMEKIAQAKDFRNRTIRLIYRAKSERDFAEVLRNQYEILSKLEKDKDVLSKRKTAIINQLKEAAKIAINSATISQIQSLERQEALYKRIDNVDPFKELLLLIPEYIAVATDGIDVLNKKIINSQDSIRKIKTLKKVILYSALLANSISIIITSIVILKKKDL